MRLAFSCSGVSLNIEGSISQVDYSWKIAPFISSLDRFDNSNESFQELFNSLYKMKKWAQLKKIFLKIKTSLIFKITFFFFCRFIES